VGADVPFFYIMGIGVGKLLKGVGWKNWWKGVPEMLGFGYRYYPFQIITFRIRAPGIIGIFKIRIFKEDFKPNRL